MVRFAGPRYERDDSLSRAARIIRERICALPEFARARSIVVMGALAECRGRDIPGMRALGGFTAVILRHVDALPEQYMINYGSELLPRTVADMLAECAGAMREELQRALCSETLAFRGERRETLASVDDHAHHLSVVNYEFPDGTIRPYVEVSEAHGGAGSKRILPLPEAVHLLQNATDSELFGIGNRST